MTLSFLVFWHKPLNQQVDIAFLVLIELIFIESETIQRDATITINFMSEMLFSQISNEKLSDFVVFNSLFIFALKCLSNKAIERMRFNTYPNQIYKLVTWYMSLEWGGPHLLFFFFKFVAVNRLPFNLNWCYFLFCFFWIRYLVRS